MDHMHVSITVISGGRTATGMENIDWEEECSPPHKYKCPADDHFRLTNTLGRVWGDPELSSEELVDDYKTFSLPGSLVLPCCQKRSDRLIPHQGPHNLAVAGSETFEVQNPTTSPFLQFPLSPSMSPRTSAETVRIYQGQDTFIPDHSQSQPATLDDPSPFLLDDDPFANLNSSAVVSTPSTPRKPLFISRPSTPVSQSIDSTLTTTLAVPRSPLSPRDSAASCYFGTTPASPPRAQSLGKLKPAYARPAFASRPSLPSLDALAHMNLVPPRKVRKGRVGAHLPFEPWENHQDPDESGMSGNELDTPCITRPASPSTILAQIQAQYVTGNVTESSITDAEFDGLSHSSSELSSQFLSDRDSFSFFDNLSTPSLEHSSASLSRSRSIESLSPSEGDDNHDNFGISLSDCPTVSFPLHNSHPTLSRKGSPTPDSDKFPRLRESVQTLYLLPPQTPAGSSTFPGEESMSTWASSRGYTENPRFGQSGADGHGNENGGRSRSNGHSTRDNGGNWGNGNGPGDDGGGDDRRGRPIHRPILSDSSTSTSSEEEDSDDDYGEPIGSKHRSKSTGCASSEDDVPLAQRIPNALQAQRTIRQQFREERDRRRQERALKAEQVKAKRSTTFDKPTHVSAMSSSQEAAFQASRQLLPKRPSTAGAAPSTTSPSLRPFAPEELARKLQDVQVAESSRVAHLRSPSVSARAASREEASRGRTGRSSDVVPPPLPQQPSQNNGRTTSSEAESRTLRAMRSFHHTQRKSDEAQQGVSLTDAAFNFARRATTTRARSRVREEPPLPPPSAWQLPPWSGSQSPPVPPLPQSRQSGEAQRKLSKTSGELERSPKTPMPIPVSNIKTQQRIFIGDLQTFNIVEIDNYTSAEDVISIVRSQGSLNGVPGHGEWMVFEVAHDFGMERPVRSYELLSDIQASWNKDKLVNMFVIKRTPLAVPLSRNAIPSSSPTHGSYVEWEMKRGKWTKRWLRLREHSLWLSKRDNGKDEILLCSLSNFDGYFVTRAYKSPKPFTFAIKSTDKLSFFENTADYMHMFSCQPHDGQKWIEKILIARSYVLYQERNVLFNPKASGGNGAPLSRAGTRKVRPSQPLVGIPPGYPGGVQSPHPDVFEPGSLLAKN